MSPMTFENAGARLGSVLAAIGGVLLSEGGPQLPQLTLWGKILLAAGGIMITWGGSNQIKDLAAAMRAPVQVMAATPAARSELAAAEAAKPPAKPTPNPEEQAILDKFGAKPS